MNITHDDLRNANMAGLVAFRLTDCDCSKPRQEPEDDRPFRHFHGCSKFKAFSSAFNASLPVTGVRFGDC